MALSLGKTKDNGNDAEARLRARLADLEGRLEDSQKIKQLENHIRHLTEKHELELEKARLEAKQGADQVKEKASGMLKKAKAKIQAEQARYKKLLRDLAALEEAMAATDERLASLAGKGLKCQLATTKPSRSVRDEPREFVAQLVSRQRDLADRLTRIEEALGDGKLQKATTDVEILQERSKELLSNPELKSKAMTVAEKARMFAQDPGKSQYYRELLAPYAEGIQQVLATEARANVVYGCQEALSVLEESFRDSRTFLLRRSGALDDHAIEAEVVVERIEESAEDALGRMRTMLDNARALGPVDFFQNMEQEIARRVERGEKGAKVAAWVLSDVTVTVLEDETVRAWLSGQQ